MKILKYTLIGLFIIILVPAAWMVNSAFQTEANIDAFHQRVEKLGFASPSPVVNKKAMARLPEPVRRYFEYVFITGVPRLAVTRVEIAGDFRRPLKDNFAPLTASQTLAAGTPALMFDASTSIVPAVWARAYDFYAEGKMEMKAKILSAITVVDESETPALNRTSLQRWLIESPLFPVALLPGGPVRWEAIDDSHARAIIEIENMSASLVATFRKDGSLKAFDAEKDGDLTTPYHGSGEHGLREDYREVSGMMIPHRFTIARASKGKVLPFLRGEVTSISHDQAR